MHIKALKNLKNKTSQKESVSLYLEIPSHGVVGVFGGSFNPVHEGHVRVCQSVLEQVPFLDRILWLIAPSNPFKKNIQVLSVKERLALARHLIQECLPQEMQKKIIVSGIEEEWNPKESVETVRLLKEKWPGVRFLWIMGADVAFELPVWPSYASFIQEIPVVVYPRLPWTSKDLQEKNPTVEWVLDAKMLLSKKLPCFLMLGGAHYDVSSTDVRSGKRSVYLFPR